MAPWADFFGEVFGWTLGESAAEEFGKKIPRRILLYSLVAFVAIIVIFIIYYNFFYVDTSRYSTFWNT